MPEGKVPAWGTPLCHPTHGCSISLSNSSVLEWAAFLYYFSQPSSIQLCRGMCQVLTCAPHFSTCSLKDKLRKGHQPSFKYSALLHEYFISLWSIWEASGCLCYGGRYSGLLYSCLYLRLTYVEPASSASDPLVISLVEGSIFRVPTGDHWVSRIKPGLTVY